MFKPVRQMQEAKKAYQAHTAAIAALPEAYQFVFHKMCEYIWSFAGGTGIETLQTQYDLADLFTEAAANGLDVRAVIGTDAAGFCDALICGHPSWMDSSRKRLNRNIQKRSSG